MNERERADELARAIDKLIDGTPPPATTRDKDHELQTLVQVAQVRLGFAKTLTGRSTDHRSTVWGQLVSRIDSAPARPRADAVEELVADDAMRRTVSVRREMSDSILSLAEQHRDDIWHRIQERLKSQRPDRREPPSSGGGSPEDRPQRQRYFPIGEQPGLREASAHEADDTQRRLHERMRGDPGRHTIELPDVEPQASFGWRWYGFMGAVALLVIGAFAPVPGLARPPAVEAARYVGQHLGVVETDSAPPDPGPATAVAPQAMDAEQAGQIMGLQLVAPAVFLGFGQTSSRFYAAGLTSEGPGVFAITYQSSDASSSVTIYEEKAGGASLAVPPSEVADVPVGADRGSYFEGSWTSADGSLMWQGTGTQTLVFEHGGLRTTLQYTGPQIDMDALTAAAAMLFPGS